MKLACCLAAAVVMLGAGCASPHDIDCWPAFEFNTAGDGGDCDLSLIGGTLADYRNRDGRRRFDLLMGGIYLSRSAEFPNHREQMWCVLFDLFHTSSYHDEFPGRAVAEGRGWRLFYGLCGSRTDSGVSRTRIPPFITVQRESGSCETSWIWRKFVSVRSDAADNTSGYFMFIPW